MAPMNTQTLCHVVAQSIPLLLDFPTRKFSVDYDRDADVLYISFDHPQNATDSEMTEDGFLLRYRGEQLIWRDHSRCIDSITPECRGRAMRTITPPKPSSRPTSSLQRPSEKNILALLVFLSGFRALVRYLENFRQNDQKI
uniref:DUF2283 domain-containing protein n=1 Tax=Candidatus Kentrum sp. UNK TaxID=2126344 RepID=A0A451B3K2_9GAMM|nr:MAG: Protein of unknown function (DUF2283) [Candidatus Kentron sp. UNK]VFK72871.1 MAG: Protein of unknown function (DUF2283) [Candidatus Kentron sp. UNK]